MGIHLNVFTAKLEMNLTEQEVINDVNVGNTDAVLKSKDDTITAIKQFNNDEKVQLNRKIIFDN